MARVPGIDLAFGLLQTQASALVALPEVVNGLAQAARGLASAAAGLGEVVAQTRDTLTVVNRLANRLDGLTAELEEPVRELAPGLRRLAAVLDDPVVGDLPDTLRQVQRDVLPVLKTLADTHEKVAGIAGTTDRLMGLVDDTSRTLSGLPGASLLGRRRGGPSRTVVVVEQEPPTLP